MPKTQLQAIFGKDSCKYRYLLFFAIESAVMIKNSKVTTGIKYVFQMANTCQKDWDLNKNKCLRILNQPLFSLTLIMQS